MMRRVGQTAIFIILVAMSLTVPLMIQAIFPPGNAGRSAPPPPEEAIMTAHPVSSAEENDRVHQNLAWLQGDTGGVTGIGEAVGASEAAEAAEQAAAESGEVPRRFDRRPGIFLGYDRSWDSLSTHREQFIGGAFVYLNDRNRILASGARLRFRDDADKISGTAVRLEGAHRMGSDWLLQEGLEEDRYDHLHNDWNGDAKISGPIAPRVGIEVDGGHQDVWERLVNIHDRLSLWQAGVSLFFELVPRWWLAALGRVGWYSDHNEKLISGGEAGYVISPSKGLSAAAGVEATSFKDQHATYWSPSYYHYVYARLRLTRDYETTPFEPEPAKASSWRDRLGYLAEVTAGVNNRGFPEVSERAGVAVHATGALSLGAEYYHLDSSGRFDEGAYSENRVNATATVRF